MNLFSIFDYKQRLGATRSSTWPAVQKAFLAEHPTCAVCDSKGKLLNPLNVHHLQSFATHPDLELNPQNLIVGCRIHHFWVFHLGNWASINESAKEDAALWLKKIQNRPKWKDGKWVYPISS